MTIKTKYSYQYLINEWDHLFLELVKYFKLDDIPRFYSNKNLTINLLENINHNKINYKFLSQNPNITLKFIENNIELPWCWKNISNNKNITIEFVNKYSSKKWSWIYLTRQLIITEDILFLYPWDKYELSKKIPYSIIKKYPNFKWDENGLSCNKSITFQIISTDKSFNWNPRFVSINPNITIDIILSNINYQWDWKFVSRNPSISMENILKYSYLPWCYASISQTEKYDFLDIINNNISIDSYWLSKNSNIKWKTFKKYEKNINWSLGGLSINTNIYPEIILNNLNYNWNKFGIVLNEFVKGKEYWINLKRLKIIKTLIIQRWWRFYSCNPSYKKAKELIINKLN